MGVVPDSAPAATQEELLVWSNATQRTEEVWPSSVETETFMCSRIACTFVVVHVFGLGGGSVCRWRTVWCERQRSGAAAAGAGSTVHNF